MAKKNYPFPENETGHNFSTRISTHMDWEPRTNIIEVGDLLVIEVELPGVNKKDVSILLQDDNELVLRGTKNQPRLNESPNRKVTHYLFEREFGSFYKKIVVDFPLDSSNIKSEMEDGVLTVRIPRKKAAKISVEIK